VDIDLAPPPTVVQDPRVDPAWAALARATGGHLFLSPPWLRAVCDTYGFAPRCRTVADTDGKPVSGLAWVPVADLVGRRDLGLPFSDHGTPVVADPAHWAALTDGLGTPTVPFTLRALDHVAPEATPGFTRASAAAWHGTTVEGDDAEALLARLSGHARRNIRVAERAGVRVRTTTGVDGVRTFHALHRRLRRDKYRLLAQPRELFDRIWSEFDAIDGVVTALAELDGQVVAGAVFLQWADVLYYKFGASVREHLAVRPNDAIFWAGLRLALERGARRVDWGLSDLDQPGLVAYKRKWAPEERTIVTWRAGGAAAPGTDEQRRLLTGLTELLTDPGVPDAVTDRAGELLYRYFC
jgi:CelD/BcsL family acetyltransferase involved in cellulose biosynthesis